MLLDLRNSEITGKELEHRLDEVHITANKNTVPNDPQSPFVTSGLRIVTPAVTTRGFGTDEMVKIAELIALTINDFQAQKEYINGCVADMCKKFPIYQD